MLKHCAIKIQRGVEVKLHVLLTSSLEGGEWVGLQSHPLPLRKKHWIGGSVGLRTTSDIMIRRKISAHLKNFVSVIQSVAYLIESQLFAHWPGSNPKYKYLQLILAVCCDKLHKPFYALTS
jgi:hypothetical protein